MISANTNRGDNTFVELVEQALRQQEDDDVVSVGEIHKPFEH